MITRFSCICIVILIQILPFLALGRVPILILIYTSQQPNYSIYTSTWLPETFYQRKLLILCISHSFTLILRDQVNNGVKTGIIVILPQVQGATSTTWVSSSPPPGPTVQYSQCVAVLLASLGWVRKAHGGGSRDSHHPDPSYIYAMYIIIKSNGSQAILRDRKPQPYPIDLVVVVVVFFVFFGGGRCRW